LNQIENEYKGRMKAGEDAESFRKQEPLVDQIGLGNQLKLPLANKCDKEVKSNCALIPAGRNVLRALISRLRQ
jgi:hypothetical protein